MKLYDLKQCLLLYRFVLLFLMKPPSVFIDNRCESMIVLFNYYYFFKCKALLVLLCYQNNNIRITSTFFSYFK